ncbi:hypothetical protein NP233_g18 [Leucocoprinus birnbaumii]|uniref:Uncharacterized protein n=1 Tax=Leucocoprinus birnbaumii TaxID=56174 RepID=A0AAD5W333_9AGAR|nr:hypothetical protein NP233_g18 [Leucocoprinus birnbaumii]
MMPLPWRTVLRFLVASFLVLQVLGQNSVQTFGWKFRTDFVSTNLPSCFNFPIVVFPNLKNATAGNYSGTPPYYMMAFPEGGQPITSLIGTDNNTLSWTPQHPIGTKLILQLVDSLGNTGGTSGSVFEVVANPDTTNCIAPSPPQDFTISSNITQGGSLQTCQPWRLNINGGQPPYTVVLDARNSPVLTNITVPPTDNAVVFINRADPNTVLFAAVVDSLGRWATGTPFVSTFGSTNVDCIGFGTITDSQSDLNQQEAERRAAQASKRRTSIIVGVVVSIVLLLLIAGAVGTWLYVRKKKRGVRHEEAVLDVTPRQFVESGSAGQVLSINNFMDTSTITTPSPMKGSFITPESHGLPYVVEPFGHDTLSIDTSTRLSTSGAGSAVSPSGGANLQSRPSFANFPATSVRRSKAQEAAQEGMSETNHTILSRSSMPSGSSGQPVWPARSGSLQGAGMSDAGEPELIYQHRDAGQVVRELPPPYIAPPDTTAESSTAEGPERRTT